MTRREIAILGVGRIGGGLARAFARRGHALHFGARDQSADDVRALATELGATVADVATATRRADVVVLAVPHAALDALLPSIADAASGKIVVDCTNAIGPGLTPKYPSTTSAAEETEKRLPGARVVKSFNAQGAENLSNPVYDRIVATNFYCGDDEEAKRVVHQLIEDVGFEAVDVGPLRSSRLLESMTLLWLTIAANVGTRDLAFKLLRR